MTCTKLDAELWILIINCGMWLADGFLTLSIIYTEGKKLNNYTNSYEGHPINRVNCLIM